MSSLKNTCFQNNTHEKTTLCVFAISLVLVNASEPVNVENERRNFSDIEDQRLQMAIELQQSSLPTCIYKGTSLFWLMGDQTVHEDGNNQF